MKAQILRPNDLYEALYIDGRKALEGHTLDVVDVLVMVLGKENVQYVNADYFPIESLVDDERGNTFLNEKLIWENGHGCPQEWPGVEPYQRS